MSAEKIHDFILKDEQSLRIAAAVSEAWPDARHKLTADFLARLGRKLVAHLDGWEFATWNRYFLDRYGAFGVWKPTWGERYYVTLQASDFGRVMHVGVQRETDDIKAFPLNNDLLAAVQQIHPSARCANWWEAIVDLRAPAADWRSPEVLWLMRKDESFLDSVAEQLLEVARAVEPIADRIASKR